MGRLTRAERAGRKKSTPISSSATNLTWALANLDYAQQMSKRQRVNGSGKSGYVRSSNGSRAFANIRTGGFLGQELKFVDYEKDANVVQTLAGSEFDPTEGALNALAQADGPSSRDGRAVILKSVHVRGVIDTTVSTDGSEALVYRVVLYCDKQTNGAAPNAEDVFVDPSDADLDAFTLRNLAFSKRFRILSDQWYDAHAVAGYGNGSTNKLFYKKIMFKIDKKLNIPVNYTGTTAAISTIVDNSLHLLIVAGPTSGAQANAKYTSRVRFVG